MTSERPRVGIFSLTSCAGCQMRILDLEEELPAILNLVDIVHFPMAKRHSYTPPFDISFVEGAVVRRDEIRELRWIRKNSALVIALGTCASYGGVPSIKNLGYKEEIEREVYPDPTFLDSIEVCEIGHYIEVDYFLRGCPIDKHEFLRVVSSLLVGKLPVHIHYPVCMDCKINENQCLLGKEVLCMGPVTYGGCGALCPSNTRPCYGCRGPLPDGNVESLLELFKSKGVSRDDLKRTFFKFAGTSKKFMKVREL